MKRGALALVLLAAAGCMRPPARLAGTFPPTTVRDAQAEPHVGERVRWGGALVSTRPGTEETCFEIVSLPLDRQARPRDTDETFGRFLACAPGFYDPAVYAPERRVTVVGTIEGTEVRKVGEYDYPFPRVRAEAVQLWPEEPRRDVVYEPYWGPYWGGWWGPYWGWGWGWYYPPHRH